MLCVFLSACLCLCSSMHLRLHTCVHVYMCVHVSTPVASSLQMSVMKFFFVPSIKPWATV